MLNEESDDDDDGNQLQSPPTNEEENIGKSDLNFHLKLLIVYLSTQLKIVFYQNRSKVMKIMLIVWNHKVMHKLIQ